MIHEIYPHKFENAFQHREPQPEDLALFYQNNQALLKKQGDELVLPRFCDLDGDFSDKSEYLFSIDHSGFFLIHSASVPTAENLGLYPLIEFRTMPCQWMAFGGITGSQLYRWKQTRQFCGRCGAPMENSRTERALVCPKCGCTEYPKICPAIIVAVTDGDRLLMARGRNTSYKRWALIAGFVEIGESFEETVRREVMEEVGIRVKNIRYYKNQPWAFSDTIMIGFFADLDGSDALSVQESELLDARWFHRDEIPETVSNASIGNELIETFRNHMQPISLPWTPERRTL